MSHTIIRYPNLAAVLDVAENTPRRPNANDASEKTPTHSWDLNLGYSGALAALKGQGLPEITSSLKSESLDYAPVTALSPTTATAYDVAGDEVDIDLYLAGEPECMRNYSAPNVLAPTLDINVDIVASAGISATQFLTRGATIVAAIDALERSGYRINLSWSLDLKCLSTHKRFSMIGHVKSPEQPLDIDMISFWFAHPAALRRIGFKLLETVKGFERATKYGYGEILNWDSFTSDLCPNAIFFPPYHLGSEFWRRDPKQIVLDIINRTEGKHE